MKKIIAFSCLLLALASCQYGKENKYIPPLPSNGEVEEIIISPKSQSLYVDSEFPTLHALVIPSNAKDTTVIWSSNHPEVLSVDPQTGVLSFGPKISNIKVTITATSKSNDKITGSCDFDIHNTYGTYRYTDIRRGTGLWILDRNIGATEPFAGQGGYLGRNNLGDYYQFGRNIPVANQAKGGDDQQGGRAWSMYKERTARALYPEEYDRWWGDSNHMRDNKFTILDWKDPKNLPIQNMEGWRIPTKEDFEKIAFYANPDNFKNARDKAAAKLMAKKLLISNGGLIRTYYLEDPSVAYLWSSDYDPNTGKAWVLKVTNINGDYPRLEVIQEDIFGRAMNIRLVRDDSTTTNETN